jgi:choline dehydrogenase-like flavoprotein
MAQEFDVIVVGSGPGGGITTHALTAAGAKVALIEVGKRLRPGVDFNAHWNIYEKLDGRMASGKTAVVSGVWRDFAESNHFTAVGDNPAHGQLRALGGRSLCWAGHSLRFGPLDFKPWPIQYDEVAPWYDKAEAFMAVYGEKNGLWNMPDGVFQKMVPMRSGERMLKSGVDSLKKKGRTMDFVPLRKAIPTEPHSSGRAVCHYCGNCMSGCEVDSKYTSANTPIPRALKTGRLTLFTNTMMTQINVDAATRRVKGILAVNEKGETIELNCKALVLSCSTIETARQLLLNKSAAFPRGLANDAGQVGRGMTSHFGITVNAEFPQIAKRNASNDDGTDYYHSLLTSLYWDKPSKDFEGTYQVQCGSGLHPRRFLIRNVAGFGSSFRRELRERNAISASMNMQGSLQASERTFVDLDESRKDRFGLALPRVQLHYSDGDLAMARDCVRTCEEIITTAGGKVVMTPGEITAQKLVIDSNHWVGSCRMGNDPRSSVVNRWGQTHDVKNLFLGDASVFTAYPEKNPTLTNVALSWRMADHLASMMKKGEL